ncbi:MAG TPA: hypothetical protein VF984_13985 [Actinomycetota bacterium]
MKVLKTRVVLLLGRRPSVRWSDVRSGIRRDDELVVLSLGYPVTSAQHAALDQAQSLAERTGAWFDAMLITSVREMLAVVRPDDRIHLAAGRLERRRLRRVLPGLPA